MLQAAAGDMAKAGWMAAYVLEGPPVAEAAAEKGFNQNQLKHFDESAAAGGALEHLLAPGDLILVKGSQFMRMERVVEEIMAETEKKGELLCRQEPEWQER